MQQDFFSSHAINDEVTFIPRYRHQQEMGIAAEELEGKIVSVRFTEAKIFYDIYNNYWGKIFDNVTSEKVFGLLDLKRIQHPTENNFEKTKK